VPAHTQGRRARTVNPKTWHGAPAAAGAGAVHADRVGKTLQRVDSTRPRRTQQRQRAAHSQLDSFDRAPPARGLGIGLARRAHGRPLRHVGGRAPPLHPAAIARRPSPCKCARAPVSVRAARANWHLRPAVSASMRPEAAVCVGRGAAKRHGARRRGASAASRRLRPLRTLPAAARRGMLVPLALRPPRKRGQLPEKLAGTSTRPTPSAASRNQVVVASPRAPVVDFEPSQRAHAV
jgi:hypothetical protein